MKGKQTVRWMNCDEARLEIALWVGNDLDEASRIEELRRHIAICPECRRHARSLQSSMVLLGAVDQDQTFDPGDSLWPDLQSRIDYLERTPKQPISAGKWVWILLAAIGVSTISWSLWPAREPVTNAEAAPAGQPAPVVPPVSPGYSHSQYVPAQGQ